MKPIQFVEKYVFIFRSGLSTRGKIQLFFFTGLLVLWSRLGNIYKSDKLFRIQFKNNADFWFRLQDLHIFFDVFQNKVYDVAALKKQKKLTIIDCGAHIGISSRYFLEHFDISKLICLEPDRRNYKILQKNIQEPFAHLLNNVIVTKKGNYPFKETLKSYNSGIQEESFDYMISGTTIKCLIEEYGLTRIDLIKIDIEGAEKQLFTGDLSWLKMVEHIIIEIHRDFSLQKLKTILLPFGFSKFQVRDQSGNVYLISK